MKKLNLGCGKKILKDFVNVDIVPGEGVVVWDLETILPFEDNTFDYILMDNVFEHIHKRGQLLKELQRIGKNGTTIDIIVPHFSSYTAYRHIEHCFYCSYFTFEDTGFNILERRFKCFKGLPLRFIFDWITNLFPRATDIYFHKFLPVQTLIVKLQIGKVCKG